MNLLKLTSLLVCVINLTIANAQIEHTEDAIALNEQEARQESTASEEEAPKKTKAQKAFEKVDKNADGIIVFREFQMHAMNIKTKSSNYGARSLELSKKFSAMDTDKDNKLNALEYEIGLIPKSEKAYILKKLEIFAKIDRNADNKIDLHEFKRVKAIGRTKYYKKGKPEYREKKFAEIDTNEDGFINLEEFEIDKQLVKKT